MKKELMAYYFEKWNCVWDNGLTQNINVQEQNEIIKIIKDNFVFLKDQEFIIEGNEIYVFVDIEKNKINYN